MKNQCEQMRLKFIALIPPLFVLSMGFARQNPVIEYRDRGNRMEGIKKIQLHGGADIDLLGVRLDGAPIPPIDSLKSVQLRFYLPASVRMKIKVKDLIDKSYEMTPHKQFWKNGWNSFIWPADAVLRRIRIQIQELVVSDSIHAATSDFVVPYLLAEENTLFQRQNYMFIFKTTGRAEITATWFQKNNRYYEEIEKNDLEQPANTPFSIERNFAATDREGFYRLQLRGRVRKLNRIVPVNREYDFYHKPFLQ